MLGLEFLIQADHFFFIKLINPSTFNFTSKVFTEHEKFLKVVQNILTHIPNYLNFCRPPIGDIKLFNIIKLITHLKSLHIHIWKLQFLCRQNSSATSLHYVMGKIFVMIKSILSLICFIQIWWCWIFKQSQPQTICRGAWARKFNFVKKN